MNFNQPVAVSICTRILKYQFEKSSLMNSFFCLFQTRILQATQAVKTEFKLDRNFISSNSIFQTRYFKILVQIDTACVTIYNISRNKLLENRTLKKNEIISTFQMNRIYFDLIIARLIVQK